MSTRFPDFLQIFDQLPTPQINVGQGRFCAHPIPGFPSCTIGKDISGCPVLLIATDNALPGAVAPTVLECLRVLHMVNCRIQQGSDGDDQRTISVLHCTAVDRAIHEYFLRSLYPIVASLPMSPSRDDVTQAVDRLIELFSQMTKAPRRTMSGLWAELYVIANSADPSRLIAAWHAIPEERYDFACGRDRIEVKAASGKRVHHFSLEQLRPALTTRVIVVSILTESSQGGVSIMDLIQCIRQRVLDSALLLRLDQIISQTVGKEWRSLTELKFDTQLAQQSLRVLDATTIPCISLPLPEQVSNVHFRVDLCGLTASVPIELIEASELFVAAHRSANGVSVSDDESRAVDPIG